MRCWAVVPAAGAGRRMGGATRKQFLSLGGRPLLVHTLSTLSAWPGFDGIVVVAPLEDVERVRWLLEGAGVQRVLRVVAGGEERHDSVRLGLDALTEAAEDDVVFVHDAVRPFAPVGRFDELRDAASPNGALLAVACRDTLKREEGGACAETVDRAGLWQAQTPQAFPVGVLRRALALGASVGLKGTDEAAFVQHLGLRPRIVPGDSRNIKVTTPEDLAAAEALASPFMRDTGQLGQGLQVGHGYDVHRLVEGRKLVLGGVAIRHPTGLLGHSDADVLTHAVADACLGAAGLGDIGRHFPDSDATWKGACSLDLLSRVASLLREKGFRVCRADVTLVAQRPKIAPHIARMEENLAQALGAPFGTVTVKATTTEGLGFEGREEGMSAHAVALLVRCAGAS